MIRFLKRKYTRLLEKIKVSSCKCFQKDTLINHTRLQLSHQQKSLLLVQLVCCNLGSIWLGCHLGYPFAAGCKNEVKVLGQDFLVISHSARLTTLTIYRYGFSIPPNIKISPSTNRDLQNNSYILLAERVLQNIWYYTVTCSWRSVTRA